MLYQNCTAILKGEVVEYVGLRSNPESRANFDADR